MNQELYEKLINDGILRSHNIKSYMKVVEEFNKEPYYIVDYEII